MKKIYLLFPILILSLFTIGCSSSDSDETPVKTPQETETPEKNVSCESNESIENGFCVNGLIDCKPDFSLNEEDICVADEIEPNPVTGNCSIGDTIENGTCQEGGIIVCNPDFSLNEEKLCVANIIDIVCEDNQKLENGICVNIQPDCLTGEILNIETNECEKDENVKALSNGTVRDGLIYGATIETCKIIDGNKSEANVTCSKTDGHGNFECAIYDEDYQLLVFKAIGGTDLGENFTDSRDDRENIDVLKTVLTKEDVENNKSSFVTPATTLVVLKSFATNWEVAEATIAVEKALGIDSVLVNNEAGIKSATIVANILDALTSETNRTEVFSTLSKEEIIYSEENGVESGLLAKLDDKITSEIENVFNTQIQKSINNPSDIVEKVIDELSSRVELNQTVSEIIAENFELTLEHEYSVKAVNLDLISEIPTVKTKDDLVVISNKISEILDAVEDDENATLFLKTELAKDNDISELTVEFVQAEIGEITCPEGQEFNNEKICVLIPEIAPVVKDAVDSPEDVPALPNETARTFEESEFPTIPNDKDYAEYNSTRLEKPSDKNPELEFKSSDNNQTTSYTNN